MKYEKPNMDVLFFNNLDIVRTSDIIGGGLGGFGSGDNGGTSVNGNSRNSDVDF